MYLRINFNATKGVRLSFMQCQSLVVICKSIFSASLILCQFCTITIFFPFLMFTSQCSDTEQHWGVVDIFPLEIK